MPEIKTSEQYVLRELANAQKELELRDKKIEELSSTPLEENKSILLHPTTIDLVRVDITAGYDIAKAVRRGEVERELVLGAITDDDKLLQLSKISISGSYTSDKNAIISYSTVDSKFVFNYNGFSVCVCNDIRNITAIPYNVHLVDQTHLGKYDKVNQGYYITLDQFEVVKGSYLKELRQNITRYKKDIEDIEVAGE